MQTYDHQFGLKKKQHSTDMCIFTLKSVNKYVTKQQVLYNYACVLDGASQDIPLVIVRIIAFWYQTQPICIKE